MFFFYYRANITMFLGLALVPTLDPTLIPTLDPTLVLTPSITQKRKAIWRLWHCRPVMDKLGTWVFFMITPSNY